MKSNTVQYKSAVQEMIPLSTEETELKKLEDIFIVHRLHKGDARDLKWIPDKSVHLVVTSPPYWTLKKYNDYEGQLGSVADYDQFIHELDEVWKHCHRVLVEGGRIVCVVGDVCLARRRNKGRHQVVPLHADISVRCRQIGFDYLTPIIWHKIANASYEIENGSSFLGKPYEPNAIVKNDIEYILMLRKPGGYRKPTQNSADSPCSQKKSKATGSDRFGLIYGERLPKTTRPRSPLNWLIV